MNAAIDNDVLFKGACYGLLGKLAKEICPVTGVRVLGAARFVILQKIQKAKLNGDRARARDHLLRFLKAAEVLEPSGPEQRMAADLELAARKLAVNLDAGESLLCAIVIRRSLDWLMTGDKRAIAAIEMLLSPEPGLLPICGRVKCLEQLFADAVTRYGHVALRSAVCTEPEIDKALAICFSCRGQAVSREGVLEGLLSYVRDLRERAKRVLAP